MFKLVHLGTYFLGVTSGGSELKHVQFPSGRSAFHWTAVLLLPHVDTNNRYLIVAGATLFLALITLTKSLRKIDDGFIIKIQLMLSNVKERRILLLFVLVSQNG